MNAALGCTMGRAVRPGRAKRGFSLFDLVTVLVIVVILAAIAIPRYAASLSRYRVEAAWRRIATDVEYARARARATGSAVKIAFSPASDSYTLSNTADLDHAAEDYSVELSADPYHADIVSVDLGGNASVWIDAYGYPASGGVVAIRSGDVQRSLRLDRATGKVHLE